MSEPRSIQAWIAYEPGTRVVLEAGPLRGVTGTVLGWDDTPCLTVLVAMSNSQVVVDLDPRWVSVEEPPMAVPKLPVH